MPGNSAFVMASQRGWACGLGNMLRNELARWQKRRWWVQCLIALMLLNGTLALNLRGNRIDSATTAFIMIAALCVPIAAIVMAEEFILGERLSGTAAWVLSKPLGRPAFILAKLIAHGLGLLVTWVAVPGTVAYFQLTAAGWSQFSKPGFVGVIGLIYLNLFFYLTLALMLATLFRGRGPVLGISMVLLWSGPMQFIAEPIQKYVPWLDMILPWRLLMPSGSDPSLAPFLALGQPLPTVVPIIATAVWSVLFVLVAIWRFSREEL